MSVNEKRSSPLEGIPQVAVAVALPVELVREELDTPPCKIRIPSIMGHCKRTFVGA